VRCEIAPVGAWIFGGNILSVWAVLVVGAVMRITFFTEQAAVAAVETWERHGFTAARSGTVVITDCPTLWAVPIIHRAIGFHQVERLDVIRPDSPTRMPNAGEKRGFSADGFS
jgi:hypothetical protein